jgi:hypothetical protein
VTYDRWPTREERAQIREEIERAGGAVNALRLIARKPLTDEQRARHASANAVADAYGYPRPYPYLEERVAAESSE